MSMSVEQRRTEVIETQHFPAGHARIAKASSRYDRRRRHWVVEVLPAIYVDHELSEYMWRVVEDWPVHELGAENRAWLSYRATWLTLRAISREITKEDT